MPSWEEISSVGGEFSSCAALRAGGGWGGRWEGKWGFRHCEWST